MKSLSHAPILRVLTLVAASAGCGSDEPGSVEVHASGQEFAKSGWPTVIDGETSAFNDGWTVRFKHVIANLSSFRLGDSGASVEALMPSSYLVDLQKGDFALWQLHDVAAQRWRDVGYRFSVPGAAAERLGEIPAAVADAMQQQGYSLWIEGTGEKDGRVVTFVFGIPGEVTAHSCFNGHDETDGLVVGGGRTERVELTLHMDHLFWDDHDAEEPRLLFGPIAYAAGEDNVVTLEELATQRLSDLRGADGAVLTDANGVPIVYVPREQLPDNNLREYLIDTALTIGHFNGEGHCTYDVAWPSG